MSVMKSILYKHSDTLKHIMKVNMDGLGKLPLKTCNKFEKRWIWSFVWLLNVFSKQPVRIGETDDH